MRIVGVVLVVADEVVVEQRREADRVGFAVRDDVAHVVDAPGAAAGDDRDRHGARHLGQAAQQGRFLAVEHHLRALAPNRLSSLVSMHIHAQLWEPPLHWKVFW